MNDDRLVRLDKDTYAAVEQISEKTGIHKAEVLSKAMAVFILYIQESAHEELRQQKQEESLIDAPPSGIIIPD